MTVYALQQDLVFLEDQVSPEKDGWRRQVTVEWRGLKLRATARRNFYLHQCEFYSEVWSRENLAWHRVQTLTPQSVIDDPQAATWKRSLGNFDDPGVDPYAVSQDVVDELLAYAQQVVA